MAKQSNAVEKPVTKNAERVLGQRFVKVRQHDKHLIEFRVFVLRPDGKMVRVFGEGIFEAQDLYCLAITLSQMARDSVGFEQDWEGEDA
jgi:hypothetical protein